MPIPERLPMEALPAWAHLNDASFVDVTIARSRIRGYNLVCDRNLSTVNETFDIPTLVIVPHSLVLNAEAVEEYARENKDFRQLLDAVGHQSPRRDILLFLLVQLANITAANQSNVGASNPWTEYIRFLPDNVPVPTRWTENERMLLAGTSLESAVNAKLSALRSELQFVRESSSNLLSWNSLLWQSGNLGLRDWILLDSWYRSRCLDLPKSGVSMVPCIDMANHSNNANAYYEENSKGEVGILLKPAMNMVKGNEITINYSGEAKSAAEMLFNYGFIDETESSNEISLPLQPLSDDPLGRAKLFIFGEAPRIHFRMTEDESLHWESAFVHLMCVNEEDGLEFRVLQDNEGGRQLRLFWLDEDVTDKAKEFEKLIADHELAAVLRLRAVVAMENSVRQHLQQMLEGDSLEDGLRDSSGAREMCIDMAGKLREIESNLLLKICGCLESEKQKLSEDPTVIKYLESMEPVGSSPEDQDDIPDEEEDFS